MSRLSNAPCCTRTGRNVEWNPDLADELGRRQVPGDREAASRTWNGGTTPGSDSLCVADHTVTAFEGDDAGPTPALFVALTMQVYVLPAVRPTTAIGRPGGFALEPTFVTPPLADEQTAENLVTLAPPLLLGPLKVTEIALERSFLAFTWFGAPGGVAPPPELTGTNDCDVFDAALVPFTFVSVTVQV